MAGSTTSKRGSEKVMAAWKARILTEASVKEIGAALDKSPAKIEGATFVGGENPTGFRLSLAYDGDDGPWCGNDVLFWLKWHQTHGGTPRPPRIIINGIPFPDLVRMHGSPSDTTIRLVAPTLSTKEVEVAARRQLELQYDDLGDVVLARGARELLQRLAATGLPWAVVTSADRRLAKARLDAAGVHPPVLVTVDDVASGKPDPEGFLVAARRLGIPIGRCLVVEDSAPGAEAGRRAGAVVAGLRGLPADVPVDDLAEVAALLPAA